MSSLFLFVAGLALTQALPSGTTASRTTVVARDDCSSAKMESDGCYTFCNSQTSVVPGPAQSASARVSCDTASCAIQNVNSVTVTDGWSVTGGLNYDIIQDSVTFSWSKSVQSGNAYTFNLQQGDDGYIIFTPSMNQVCGDLKRYGYASESQEGFVPLEHSGGGHTCDNVPSSGEKPNAEDTNACGTSPQTLPNGQANGAFTFCYTNGTDCKPLTPTNNNQKRSAWSVAVPAPMAA